MQRIGMQEGFDIGLEMSGAPQAFDQMIDHMIMGGKIAMLGIPSQPVPVDWNRVIFKSLTIKGIYGREMFETWYKMIAMLQIGPRRAQSHHPPLRRSANIKPHSTR